MKTQVIYPPTHEEWLKLRKGVITSTKCAALFGLSKYSTEFEVYHEITGAFDSEFTENERMKWGNRLEQSIAEGAAEEMGWVIEPMKEFYLDEEKRLGSSFDFKILGEKDKGAWLNPAILEVKNVDSLIYLNEWTEDEAPAHIELQLQFQMLLSGMHLGYIVALVGGNELKIIERKAEPQIHEAILKTCAEFWTKVDSGTPPAPNFEKDASFITDFYRQSSDDIYEAEHDEKMHDLATRYEQANKDFREANARKKAIQAEIFHTIGNAKKVLGGDYTISCATTKDSEIKAHIRKGYRGFRLTWKKGK